MSAFSGAFSSGIANLSGVFTSGALNMSTHLHIILPEPDKMRGTLLLLHGLKGGSEDWQRKTSIERYAAEYGLAVFMPEVQRSWYIDMKWVLGSEARTNTSGPFCRLYVSQSAALPARPP